MILLIGLGNPEKKYANTRHNVGHVIIDELEKEKPDDFILAKTETFMNLSGQSVKKIIKNLQLEIKNLIVVHDDIDLPLGEFKIQKGRGSAGHKGVQSIINELGANDFWRIRIGICPKRGKPENVERFVLQKFTKEEQKILKDVFAKIADSLDIWDVGHPP